jgi:hypothetical protein
MKTSRQRERLLLRAARRIDDGAPARRVCRDLGIGENEITAWRWERVNQVLWLSGRVSELEWENARLRATVGDLRCHRQMLLDAFNLVFPAPAIAPEPLAKEEAPSPPRRKPGARDRGRAWLM